MRKQYPVMIAIVIFSFLALCLGQANAFSIRELLGIEDDQAGAEATQASPQSGDKSDTQSVQNWAKQDADVPRKELKFSDIRLILANLDENQRDTLLGDEKVFKQFVKNELNGLSVLAAAESNQLQKEPNTVFLMQRSAENVLRQIYLRRLIANKIPQDFPSEEQIKSYYDANIGEFVIGERIHVWQIFLPVSGEMSEKEKTEVEKKAEAIVKDIKTGKLTFSEAAVKYSENLPSKNNGGYMGLLQVKDLLPEIRKTLAKLPEGKLSQPVKTSTGVHILKGASRVDAQDIPFSQAREQIRNLLLNRAQTQLRDAIFEQAAKTYPVDVPESRIEEWRLRLRTNLDNAKVD